ncbi:PQQ repeat protein [Streptomyces laurentii]|uniref:PQQ repeat protein n=1 Tax=Streptomyces laurentii TaxID=39478 RepID=A0A160NX59_STRLU|nr:PQQ repeat protein [Streptomyces laurentii]
MGLRPRAAVGRLRLRTRFRLPVKGLTNQLTALAVAGGVVLVSGDPLIGRDLVTGKDRRRRTGVAVPGANLLVSGGTLYLASAQYDGDVVGLDPSTGKETGRSRLGGGRFTQPRPIAADDRHGYVLSRPSTRAPGRRSGRSSATWAPRSTASRP